jgi:hypothetical protein
VNAGSNPSEGQGGGVPRIRYLHTDTLVALMCDRPWAVLTDETGDRLVLSRPDQTFEAALAISTETLVASLDADLARLLAAPTTSAA